MNIYLLNILFALLGAVIVVAPFVRQMKRSGHTNGHCATPRSNDVRAADFDYVARTSVH